MVLIWFQIFEIEKAKEVLEKTALDKTTAEVIKRKISKVESGNSHIDPRALWARRIKQINHRVEGGEAGPTYREEGGGEEGQPAHLHQGEGGQEQGEDNRAGDQDWGAGD